MCVWMRSGFYKYNLRWELRLNSLVNLVIYMLMIETNMYQCKSSTRTWSPKFQTEDKDSGNTKIFHVIAWHTPQPGHCPCHFKQRHLTKILRFLDQWQGHHTSGTDAQRPFLPKKESSESYALTKEKTYLTP